MLLRVPELVPPAAVARIRSLIETAEWLDVRAPTPVTAGQSLPVLGNRQLADASKSAQAASAIVLDALGQNLLFFTAALPKRVVPPLFVRHDPLASGPAPTIEGAMRMSPTTGTQVRVDIGVTLFLSDPREYEGGELLLDDHLASHSLKLRAGDAVLYPASTITCVQTISRGVRMSANLWVESMIRENERRQLLFEMDTAITALRGRGGDNDELMRLTACYHNLTRMWSTP